MKTTETNTYYNKIYQSKEVDKLLKDKNYSDALVILLRNQKLDWKLLEKGYSSLEKIKTKTFQFDGFSVDVQFNPRRIKSTNADISKEVIANRKCSLCLENLPIEQKGINYKDEYLILCNPYPIFYEHFTIVFKKHFPQNIDDSFYSFLKLAKRVGKYYSVLYNGPECGASAPDHLHFQAVNKKQLKILNESDSLIKKYGEKIFSNRKKEVYGINDGIRKFIMIKSNDLGFINNLFKILFNSFKQALSINNEPMFNIVGDYDESMGWSIYIFLRKKHRPNCYFEKGENMLMISPAVIDMTGILVLPREKDFKKITNDSIKEIFDEVIIGKELFDYLKSHLNKILKHQLFLTHQITDKL